MITEVASTTNTTTTTDKSDSSSSLGQADFLQLLVTQLQNQDPTDPIKNEDFIAQLATFSSLEQLVNINSSLESLSLLESSINNSQAVNLIGKEVTVQGDAIRVSDGEASRGCFYLDEPAAKVTVTITDENGVVVRTIEMGAQAAGDEIEVKWDGLDNNGEAVGDGTYNYSVTAVDDEGAEVSSTSFTQVLVEGITFQNGYVYLVSGDQYYLLSDVLDVRIGE
jgi:flagellar basal-body rod modification protein FlgD